MGLLSASLVPRPHLSREKGVVTIEQFLGSVVKSLNSHQTLFLVRGGVWAQD